MSEKNREVAGEGGRAGGRSSQSVLFETYIAELDRLRRIAAGMGLGAADAEDALQDVSVKALRQRRKCKSRDEAVRWLTKVTVNRCLMHHRRRKRFSRSAAEIIKRRTENAVEPAGTDAKAIAAEELEIVRQTLSELDGSLLTTMALRYFCGLNSTEIGQALGLSASAVRSRLREGRMILAKRLMERGIEP
ncbi:MAG TPA: sigma-70 family RNA polymerase sigma factor [Sedimentisphaerales bacterium]|nr:sigma-70 family RNA polymerase sigma factor [Sedimentisphaerales bacterium]